jgi:predicted dithiol-disulfide oxidoreductase (DUF899 family)
MAKQRTSARLTDHAVVTREKWLDARKALFKAHDRLKEKRRALPWVRVDKEYVFDGPNGKQSLADLFDGKSQLVVYHFMFAPRWGEGCPHCSFWSDHYDSLQWHLGQRDTAFVVISRAALKKLQAFRRRMGWKFKWLSSGGGDFNFDFQASFTPEQIASGRAMFNYETLGPDMVGMTDREGASVFYKDEAGTVYHTYSTWARGIDLLNTTYNVLDLTAKGRDEDPEATQGWVRFHDEYPRDTPKRKKPKRTKS